MLNPSSPRLICIDGPAGAGKTTFAAELAQSLPRCEVIHLDDMYNGWEEDLDQDFTARLQQQLVQPLLSGAPVSYQRFDWHAYEFQESVQVPACDWLIVEGVGAAQRILREHATDSIFIEVPVEVGAQRVAERDSAEVASHIERWQAVEAAHFAREQTREGVSQILGSAN